MHAGSYAYQATARALRMRTLSQIDTSTPTASFARNRAFIIVDDELLRG